MANEHSDQIASAIPHLKPLLQLHEAEFVKVAYQTLLKRQPEAEGIAYYVEQIRNGVPKLNLLINISSSEEAQQHAVEIPGLHKAIRQQKIIGLPYIGWIFKFFISSDDFNVISPMGEFLKRNNNEFVEYAYRAILGRNPDHIGLNYYLCLLKEGVPKIIILGQVVNSQEARTRGVKMPGLHAAIIRHKLGKVPLIGSLLKIFSTDEGMSSAEIRLRVLEQQFVLLEKQVDIHFEHLDDSITKLQHLIVDQGVQGSISIKRQEKSFVSTDNPETFKPVENNSSHTAIENPLSTALRMVHQWPIGRRINV